MRPKLRLHAVTADSCRDLHRRLHPLRLEEGDHDIRAPRTPRHIERRRAEPVGRIHIGASRDEQLGHLRVEEAERAASGARLQRARMPLARPLSLGSASRCKASRCRASRCTTSALPHLQASLLCCQVQRRVLVVCRDVHASAVIEEQPRRVSGPSQRSSVQSGGAILRARVSIRAPRAEQQGTECSSAQHKPQAWGSSGHAHSLERRRDADSR